MKTGHPYQSFILRMNEVLLKEDYEREAVIDKIAFVKSFPRLKRSNKEDKVALQKYFS